ncbi:MAG: TIGR02253 family HAD-type hydrolase [Candidatus ainarchaeum sp.]|nr:TIGR02253 family HAD-type hydrolase [Candidatus ainarchaeum sp.]
MKACIFFDVDNTLFPTSEFAELARRNAIRAMVETGLDASERELYKGLQRLIREKGSNYSNHFDILLKRMGVERPARYVAAAVAAYHNTKSSIQPYPEVPKTLMELKKRGYRLYVATNGDAVKQWDKLIRMGIHLFFEDVFVSGEIGEEKGPSFFQKVLARARARPSECIMVGDRMDSDILPAKKLGIYTVRVMQGPYSKGKGKADAQIRKFSELLGIVKKL